MGDPLGTGAAVVVQAGERRSARVESMRAVAALAVLVSHVWLYSHRFGPSSYDSYPHRLIAGGGLGVQLFFALSGYLIFRPFARRDFGEGSPIDLRTYGRNRAVRILPLYFVAVTLLLVFTADGGSLSQWWRFATFTEEFSRSTAQTLDGPIWSVVVEIFFYALLPLLALALARMCRHRRPAAIATLLVIGVVSVAFRRLDLDPQVVWRYSLPGTFYGFVPGMVLALIQIDWERRKPGFVRGLAASGDAWLIAGAVLWAVCCWDFDWAVPLTAFAAFLTVGAIVLPLEHGPLTRLFDWRVLALIGVASYSLYIWHVPIIEQLYQHPGGDSFLKLFVVAVPLALLAAAVSYIVVERPSLALRRRWTRDSPAPETAPTESPVRETSLVGRWHTVRDRITFDWRVVIGLSALGFLVRARMVMATRTLVLRADAVDYDRLGRLIAGGHGFGPAVLSPSGGPTAFRPPLYPIFLGAVYKLSGDSVLAARLVQSALGGATVVLLWLIARRLFDRRTALVAAAVAALYPPLVVTSTALMSEALFVPIMLCAVLSALVAREPGRDTWRWTLVTGVFVGAGILTRPNSVAMLPALLVLVAARARASDQRRAALTRVGFVMLAAIVVILPWQIRNQRTMSGTVLISDIDGYNFAGVYNDDSAHAAYPARYQFRPPIGVAELAPLFRDPTYDEVSLGNELRRRGVEHITDHPTAPAQALFWNSFRMLELSGLDQSTVVTEEAGFGRTTAAVAMVSFWILAALALVGLGYEAVRRVPRALWAAPVLLWLGTAFFLGNARLRAPIEPFFILAAAPVVTALVSRVADRIGVSRRPVTAPATDAS